MTTPTTNRSHKRHLESTEPVNYFDALPQDVRNMIVGYLAKETLGAALDVRNYSCTSRSFRNDITNAGFTKKDISKMKTISKDQLQGDAYKNVIVFHDKLGTIMFFEETMKADFVMRTWRKGITNDRPQSSFIEHGLYEIQDTQTDRFKKKHTLSNHPTRETEGQILKDFRLENGRTYLDFLSGFSFERR